MVSTHNMMISTVNLAKSTQAHSYPSSEHSADCESGPWSACSSSDMCTPMPHMTSHPINHKRFSNASDRSLTSATQMSATSSDNEPMDYHSSKFPQPATSPTLLSTGHNALSDLMSAGAQHYALHPGGQAWPIEENSASNGVPSSITDGSHAIPPSSHAFNNWRPESIGRAPFDGYYPAKAAATYDAGEHCRTASHHSAASSMDSWSSHNYSEMNSAFPRPGSNILLPQMSTSNLVNRPWPGMNVFPATHASSLKQNNLMAAQVSLESFNLQKTPLEARSLLDSLTPIPSAYSNPQLGLASTPLMDSQTLLAYNAAFGASPLLYLYGLTPDLLAARGNAVAQLAANASAASNFPGASSSSVVDDGLSPANKKTNLYKTELCRSWEEKGTCRYGSKCQFAHGQEELKNVNRHPKFKTEVCRTFWLRGSCPYGKRCCFLHTTSTEGGAPSATDARDNNQASKSARNSHDPPTSRLQKRVSANPLSAISPSEKFHGASSSTPPLQSAPVTRSLSDFSHSRSNSNSSSSLSSDGSSHIDSLRIQIWPRFGARDQVPPQDAPGPRSRLQRLRPNEDYAESPSSLPSTSTLSTTRYSPFVDRHQPPHSAFSDISSILVRSSSQQIGKARSATGEAEAQWP